MKKISLDLVKDETRDDRKDQQYERVLKRTAVRGIIRKGGCYLIIYSKYGDCKFPGGGQYKGERMADTLSREVREETGYEVKADTVREYMAVFERCRWTAGELMEMTSYYYFCEVSDVPGARELSGQEQEYDYQAAWLPLEEIIKRNEAVEDLDAVPWVVRERKVMRCLAGDVQNDEKQWEGSISGNGFISKEKSRAGADHGMEAEV